MNTKVDKSSTYRILMILRKLMNEPDQHTKKMLAEDFGVSVDTIGRDFYVLRKAGFKVVHSDFPDYKYSIDENTKTTPMPGI